MKQLTTNDGQVFGPFNEIETLEDRYVCGGNVHLPFTVIGNDAVIGDWVEPVVEEPVQE